MANEEQNKYRDYLVDPLGLETTEEKTDASNIRVSQVTKFDSFLELDSMLLIRSKAILEEFKETYKDKIDERTGLYKITLAEYKDNKTYYQIATMLNRMHSSDVYTNKINEYVLSFDLLMKEYTERIINNYFENKADEEIVKKTR